MVAIRFWVVVKDINRDRLDVECSGALDSLKNGYSGVKKLTLVVLLYLDSGLS